MKHRVISVKFRAIVVFIAVLFSSMLGANLFGVSLNKIALIPLLLVLLYDNYENKKPYKCGSSTFIYLFFFFFASVSSVLALFADYADKYAGYKSSEILFIVQIFLIYIPLLILLNKTSNKNLYFDYFKRAIVLVARLNILWAVSQFIIYYLTGNDINLNTIAFFYNSGTYTYSSATSFLEGVGEILRITGLCFDPAYCGFILLVGYCFDRSVWFKILYFLGTVLAISRTTIFAIMFVFIVNIILSLYNNRGVIKFSRLKQIAVVLIITLLAVLIIASYFDLSDFVKVFLMKLNFKNNGDIGDGRHMLYPKAALYILFHKYNVLQFLFGFGPRNSGTILVNFAPQYNSYMTQSFLAEMWATECDFSELLLGYGVIGFILYVVLMLKNFKVNNKYSVIYLAFLFVGFMYDISSSTYLTLIMIFTCAGFCDYIHQAEKAEIKLKTGSLKSLNGNAGGVDA